MEVFYQNVTALIPVSRFRSREELSAFVFDGKGKYLANAHKKNQDLSLRRAKKIADALAVPLDVLVEEDPAIPQALDQFVNIINALSQSRCVDQLGGLIEHVDLYHAVKSNDPSLKVYRVGRNSLSSQVLQQAGLSKMRKAVRSITPDLDARLRTSYEAAAAGLPVLSIETLDEKVPVPPHHIRIRYLRLLMSVSGPDQMPLVLTYCYPLPLA